MGSKVADEVIQNIGQLVGLFGRLKSVLQETGKPIRVNAKYWKAQRRDAQNKLLHMWLHEIAQQWCETHGECFSMEAWKIDIKERFLWYETIDTPSGEKQVIVSTADLGVEEFSEFLQKIEWYATSELELNITKTGDDYDISYGRKAA